MSTYQVLTSLFSKKYHLLFLSVLILILAGAFEVVSVVGIVPLLDIMIHKDLNQAGPITSKIVDVLNYCGISASGINLIFFLLLIIMLKACFTFLGYYINLIIQFRVAKDFIVGIFENIMGASWKFFVINKYGTLGNSLLHEWNRVHVLFENGAQLLDTAIRIIFYFTLIMFISWKLTLVVSGIAIILVIPFWKIGKIIHRYSEKQIKASNEYYSFIIEMFNAIKIILGYGKMMKTKTLFKDRVELYIKYPFRLMLMQNASARSLEPFVMISVCSAIYLGFYYYHIEVTELLVLLFSLKMGSTLLKNGVDKRNTFLANIPGVKQLYEINSQAKEMKQVTGRKGFTRFKNQIVFKNVAFSYSSQKDVLHNVTIVIPKGKMVALVGKSGAGKSTLSDILMGFYQVGDGTVLVDGIPLYQYDIISWRKKIGYVPQEPFLFNVSIRDNILWSMETTNEDDIYQACEMANAMEFIEELPDQFDTIVGERGIRLSGGQRQRIALARAIVRNPEILVLDEATSALDSHSELLVQNSIETIAQHTTIFVIAHRLSTIQKANCIYLLDDGTIVESGTFEDLINIKNGKFLESVNLQGFNSK